MKHSLKTLTALLAAALTFIGCAPAFGQATVMNNTNTLRIFRPNENQFWKSNAVPILEALDLDLSINSGLPNGTGAWVHWSQILGMPVAFADGTDDGGGGSGLTSITLAPPTAMNVSGSPATGSTGAFTLSWQAIPARSFLAGPTSGADAAPTVRLLDEADIPAAFLTATEGAAAFQPKDTDLDDLADGELTGSKVGTGINADNITGGTVADGRVAATIMRDSEAAAAFQPLDADLTDLADGSLSGGAVGPGINADNITTGTVADGRIATEIMRDSEAAAAFQPIDADLTDLADGSLTGSKVGTGIDDDNVSFDDADNLWTASTVGAALEELNDSINAGAANGTGAKLHWSQILGVPAGIADGVDSGGSTFFNGSEVSGPNFLDNWAGKLLLTGTNATIVPQEIQSTTTASWTPDFAAGRSHEVTANGALTLNAPSNVNSDMVGHTFTLVFIQDGTGNRALTVASNYLFGADLTGLTLSTNSGARDYCTVFVRRTNAFDVIGFVRGYAQ